ncbi:MAG: DNA-dependent ATPase I and helicase II [Parcubacteria group bacterium LiPW_41]|nr:MAG: DNA-dependent ATPase I and helicase II [Parcubacteria group bacterium LiPW_41]
MNKEDFEKELKKLNKKQKEAVDAIDGPVMVVAGPGTGKTQVLALRIVNILRTRDVSPNNILCLTFTDAGAMNMRERLQQFIGKDAYRIGVYTFHAFCNSIISRYPESFFSAASFSQVSDLDRAEIVSLLFDRLPHGHPLAGKHPELGYVYRSNVMDRIKHIKSGGYRPDEYCALVDACIEEHNSVNDVMGGWPARVSIKQINFISAIKEQLTKLKGAYGSYLSKTLQLAIDRTELEGNTEAISEWKKKYFEQSGGGWALKDSVRAERMRAVAEFYRDYEREMYMRGFYDYDDMIIEVAHALVGDAVIRGELEEQYQYILIDEFQDTNEAQINLVRAITGNPAHEGKPNVMVVGDDDQAIFKFQGAEISNITDFRNTMYHDVQTIILDINYRSHQEIIDLARSVIVQGKNRLENRFKDIVKELKQGNEKITHGTIEVKQYKSDVAEYNAVAKKIRELIDSGEDPEEIAIISYRHRILQDLIPYLDRVGVPTLYQRSADVFDELHIRELITVCNFIASVNSASERRDDLLPTIFSFPYFNIPRAILFDIAVNAKDLHRSWADITRTCEDERVKKVVALLGDLGVRAHVMPLEELLQEYMNRSGFRDYYFSAEVRKTHPIQYVTFLASLNKFVDALREWREGKPIFAVDVNEFVLLYRSEGISLSCESEVIKAAKAVPLLTAHKAKGLEFGTVFVVGANHETWFGRGKTNSATIPAPLIPLIVPAGNDEDDLIRLFYVATTRAKHTLYISCSDQVISLIDNKQLKNISLDEPSGSEIEELGIALSLVATPYKEDEHVVLSRAVRRFILPVTSLNNFVDITHGGPLYFIEQNLLRFPQPMSVPLVYGSAIDLAFTELVRYKRKNGVDPELDHILGVFRRRLARGRLSDLEMKRHLMRGEDVLARYYKLRNEFSDCESQVDFSDDGILVGDARITGKIDLVEVKDGAFHVIDFKTGKASDSWKGNDLEAVKLYNYKKQLIFYKILLDRSARWKLPVGVLALEFVDAIKTEEERTFLVYNPVKEEEERLLRLIDAVYKKITSLDFPDISKYEKNIKGIIAFEDDLIYGRI